LGQLIDQGRIDGWSIPIAPRGRPPFPALVTAERIDDAEGAPPGIRWLLRDITREERAEQQIAGLTNDLEQRIEQRTRELIEIGQLRAHIEAEERRAAQDAARREPMIVPDVIAAGARSRFLRQTISSLVGVPILSAGELIGVLHAGARAPRDFTENDVRLLELVAERAALAIESSRVYEAELEARHEAESAQMRLAFLAEASTLLGGSLSSPEAFENLARLAVTFLTDLCLIDGGQG